MTTQAVQHVIETLPSIDKDGLALIKQAVENLSGSSYEKTAIGFEDIFYQAFIVEMETNGIRFRSSYQDFKESSKYKTWKKSLTGTEQLVDKHFSKVAKSRIEKIALCRLLISVLITNMKTYKIPVTFNTIISHLNRIPETFTNEFPGYIENGMAHVVVLAMRRKGFYV